jgi:hypothetical protein
MSPTPDDRPPPAYGPGDQLRHDLKSALTTIHARAQLLGRAVRRAPSVGHIANAHPAPPRGLETTLPLAVRRAGSLVVTSPAWLLVS